MYIIINENIVRRAVIFKQLIAPKVTWKKHSCVIVGVELSNINPDTASALTQVLKMLAL